MTEEKMSRKSSVDKCNEEIFGIFSTYLNLMPDFVDGETIKEICGGASDDRAEETAFAALVAAACGANVACLGPSVERFADLTSGLTPTLNIDCGLL